ncbi:2-dehydropantoate 2-reductase [Streptococcus ovis]|uniref:2-dehydropantoate 2-reductase n=1 Tax=Streptococcus ovis TaxID=82806 RepID=UPI00037C89D9|nr:2-dehydropantoate 2-reductase [Streptococcus ovis]
MKIYIAGAGAMGCRFGVQLSEAGNDVTLLDNWEAHIQAIQQEGLKVVGDEEKTVQLPIMKPVEVEGEADLVILFTKAMQLKQMLQDIETVVGEQTRVLCLLNGLGHADVIKEYVPESNILMGVTVWTAGLKGPGTVLMQGNGTINLQSLDASQEASGREITDVLNGAGLNATYDTDVVPSIWRKACVNGTMNSGCALLDCTIGELFASESGLKIVREIIHEFVSVGIAEGVDLNEEEITNYVMDISVKAAPHYPSMHQDLVQNRRLTEIDYLNGAVNEKAKRLGISTPYCQMMTQLIHTKEDIFGIN